MLVRLIFRNIIVIYCSFWIFGCSTLSKKYSPKQTDLILNLDIKTTVQNELTEEQVHQDVEILSYALGKAYGGVLVHPKNILHSVDTELRKLNSPMPTELFCENIAKILFLIPDGHINISLNNKSCGKRNNPMKNVGENLNKSKKNWSTFLKRVKNKNVLIVAISSFPPGVWTNFETEIKKNLKKADSVIIDLRGNGGGDDASGKLLADTLAGQDVNDPLAEFVQRQSPEALIIWMNYLSVVKKMILSNDSQNKDAVDAIEKYLAKAKAELLLANSGKLEEYNVEQAKNSSVSLQKEMAFKGKIFILQDRKCFSSCESTIDFFEYFPNVTKVGDHTGGMIQFGNVGVLKLKNSGIGIQMPTKANIYKDKRFIELVGVAPNIRIEDGKDAYQAVLDLL